MLAVFFFLLFYAVRGTHAFLISSEGLVPGDQNYNDTLSSTQSPSSVSSFICTRAICTPWSLLPAYYMFAYA